MKRLSLSLVAMLLVVPLLGACGSDDSPTIAGDDTTTTTEAAATGPTLEGKEFSFVIPTDLKAGTTTWNLTNTGVQTHAFNIVKVDGTHTLEELMQAAESEEGPPAWMSSAGGSVLDPGQDRQYTGTFEAGNYGIYCPIPSSDPADQGKAHSALGMVALFAIADGADAGAFPTEDLTITAKDFVWEGADKITAGEHTIKFVNSGPEDHELIAFKLVDGKAAKDVAAFFDPESQPGPPPFTGIPQLVAPLKAGQQAVLTSSWEAGSYGFFCFVGNQKGPHFTQGMMADFTVK